LENSDNVLLVEDEEIEFPESATAAATDAHVATDTPVAAEQSFARTVFNAAVGVCVIGAIVSSTLAAVPAIALIKCASTLKSQPAVEPLEPSEDVDAMLERPVITVIPATADIVLPFVEQEEVEEEEVASVQEVCNNSKLL
jgi:hypothetical protein